MYIKFPPEHFDDPAEEQLDLLGRAYIPPFLQGRRARPIFVLTDQRLYQFGMVAHESFAGTLSWRPGRVSVGLDDIVEVTYRELPHRFLALLSVLLLLAGPIGMIAGGVLRDQLVTGLGALSLALGTLIGALYYMGRRLILVVQLRAGMMVTRLDWYRRGDVKAFQRGIWRKIDAMKPIVAPPSLHWVHDWQGDLDR